MHISINLYKYSFWERNKYFNVRREARNKWMYRRDCILFSMLMFLFRAIGESPRRIASRFSYQKAPYLRQHDVQNQYIRCVMCDAFIAVFDFIKKLFCLRNNVNNESINYNTLFKNLIITFKIRIINREICIVRIFILLLRYRWNLINIERL